MKKYLQKLLLSCFLIGTSALVFSSEQLQIGFAKETLARTASHITIHALKTDDDFLSIIAFAATVSGIQITTEFIIALMHELGHAIPAKLLTKRPVEVIMGSYEKNDPTIVTTPEIGIMPKISIKSLSMYGCTLFNAKNRIHQAIITTSGPITGFATGLGLIQSYAYLNANNIMSPFMSKTLTMCTAYSAVCSLANLIPSRSNSDGYLFAKKALALPEKHLKIINTIGNWLAIPAIVFGTYYLFINS